MLTPMVEVNVLYQRTNSYYVNSGVIVVQEQNHLLLLVCLVSSFKFLGFVSCYLYGVSKNINISDRKSVV